MPVFEIIVKSEDSALSLKLPDEVVERIKEVSSLNKDDLKELDNEKVLDMIVKSLDRLLYGFDHTKSHDETTTKTERGEVKTEKKENVSKEE